MVSRRKLNDDEITALVETIPGWSFAGGRLRTEFATGNFKNGINLINQIGELADRLNHHPDVYLSYRKVVVKTYTHDVGGITEFDFELAKGISGLVE